MHLGLMPPVMLTYGVQRCVKWCVVSLLSPSARKRTLLIKALSSSAEGIWPCETVVKHSSSRPSSEAILEGPLRNNYAVHSNTGTDSSLPVLRSI